MLELSGIRAGYGRLPVLFELDLNVSAGEWVTVVGSNGSGRSTLLKTILGETDVTGGEVMFEGQRITRLATYGRIERGIAIAPEGRRIFPSLSVTENLRTGANTIGRRQMAAQIEQVHDVFPRLGERAKQRAGSLSGGEQQMLAIGRALMSRPKLLLIDELSLGLAPLVVASLTEAIAKLCKEGGLGVIVVDEIHTHATAVAADRQLVIEKGRFVSGAAVMTESVRFAALR
jgi:branched-chain amino acid transport system ATP-binding protein